MIAVFGTQRPLPAANTHSETSLEIEDEILVNTTFENLYQSLPTRHKAMVEEHLFGGGANGIAWVDSDTQLFSAAPDGSAVFFKGALHNNPTDLEDVDFILQEYLNFSSSGDDLEENLDSPVMETFCTLQGSFAFIIWDRRLGRVLAARDHDGQEPFFWGKAQPEGILFSSDRSLIENECIGVDEFPAGNLFLSDPGSTVGKLTHMIESRKRLRRDSCSESANNLSGLVISRVPSKSHIEAM